MKALVQTIVAQAFVGSLAWWYYNVRIGWLGMTYFDRISMRWMDVAVLGGLFASCLVYWRQARAPGDHALVRGHRAAMLLSFILALCLAVAVIVTFVLVPYVPASFPPATPGTWISLTLDIGAPFAAAAVLLSVVISLLHVLFMQHRIAEPGAAPNGGPTESLGSSGVSGGPPSVS